MSETQVVETAVNQGPDIDALKAQYGKLYKVTFDKDAYFITRQLKRNEYKQLIENITPKDGSPIVPDVHFEAVVQKGLVWPKVTPELLFNSAAGYIPTLAAQILENSGFTNQVQVSEL